MKIGKNKNKYYFFKKYFTTENIRTLVFCIIILILVINNLRTKSFNLSNFIDLKLLFSIIILFFSDWVAKAINRVIQNKYEDDAKLSSDYNAIANKYRLSKLINYEYNGINIVLPYEFVVKVNNNLIINDSNERMYKLPKQVCDASSYIFDVHKGSIVYNNINIRLDDLVIKGDAIELYTSRTHYFDSLITNRACDLVLKDGRSIREIFEPGPYIKPFKLTKMSNHIGFNGMIITSDGYVPLIIRSRDVSIAKGVLSTSVSASLKTKYAVDKNTFNFTIHGLANAIRNEIQDELNIDMINIPDTDILNCIKYFYIDLIECGKPQFFVYCKIPYSMEQVKKCFHDKSMIDSYNYFVGKEQKMKKDGDQILFFKTQDLFESKLICKKNYGNNTYRYDRLIISDKKYNITPGMLLSIQLLKNLIT